MKKQSIHYCLIKKLRIFFYNIENEITNIQQRIRTISLKNNKINNKKSNNVISNILDEKRYYKYKVFPVDSRGYIIFDINDIEHRMFTHNKDDIEKFKDEYIEKYGGKYDIYQYETFDMYMTDPRPSWCERINFYHHKLSITKNSYLKENFIDKGYIPGKIILLYENKDPGKIEDDTIENFYDKFQFASPNQKTTPSKYFKYRKNIPYQIEQQVDKQESNSSNLNTSSNSSNYNV